MLKRKQFHEMIKLRRATIICIALWLIVFLAATSFGLSNIHAPTPDEAHDIQQARLFYLQPSTFLNDQISASVNKNPLISFVLNRPLHVIYVSISMLIANMGSVSAYAVGAFEVSMLVFATYVCAEAISGSTKIALLSALLIGLNPVVFQVGIGILTDVSVALYLVIGYGFYAESFTWSNEGKVSKINPKSLALSGFTFAIALLVKSQTFLFFFALLVASFLFILFKSRKTLANGYTAFKILTGLVVTYLAIDLYFVLGIYYIKTLPGISVISKFLVNSFFENIYELVRPSAYALASGVLPLSSITPAYVAERLYIAILSPNYLTFAVFFLFFAGIVTIFALEKSQIRNHAIFTTTLFASPIVISLLRPTWELARGVIFLYPFIVIIAAYGFFKVIPRKNSPYFLALCISFIAFVFLSEYLLQLNSNPIPGGILGSAITLPTFLLLLPSLPIVFWKVLPLSLPNRRSISKSFKSKWKSFAIVTSKSQVMALMSIVILCFSSIFLTGYYTTISYRHQVSPAYDMAANWLDSHVSQGDVVMSNNFFLDYFMKDSTFLKTSFQTLPGDFNTFKDLEKNVTYLVLFTQGVNPLQWETNIPYGYLYAFTSSVNPPNGMMTVYQYPEDFPVVHIYAHIVDKPNKLILSNDLKGVPYWTSYSLEPNSGQVGTTTLSANITVNDSASGSLKMTVNAGTFRYSGISHVFEVSQNLSDYNYLSFSWFGQGTNNTFYIEARAPDSDNRFVLSFSDGNTGWNQLYFPFSNFLAFGNASWCDIKQISIFTDGKPETWYINGVFINRFP